MSTKAGELSTRLAELGTKMNGLLDSNEKLNPDQQSQFNTMLGEARDIRGQLDGIVSKSEMREEALAATRPLLKARRADSQDVYESGQNPNRPSTSMRGRLCAEMWNDPNPPDFGFKSLPEQVRAIRYGDSARLAAAGQTVGGPGSEGGFAVAPTYEFATWDKSLESEIVRPRCNVIGMTTIEHNVSTFDDNDHSAGLLFGGLKAEFLGEGDAINYKTAKIRRTKLYANMMGFLIATTNQLLQDASGFENGIQTRMPLVLGWNLDRYCLVDGTGSGQPRSILNDPAMITVAKETGQPGATIVYENLTKMFSRLHPSCLKNAVWVVNQSAIPSLLELSISVGTGGTVIPVMKGTAGNFEILTLPVVFTEKLPTLGTVGDIMLVDFSQYALGIVKNSMRLDMSQHVRFTTDESVWRILARFDGQGTWKSAFTPKNGNSLSWCVSVATRA